MTCRKILFCGLPLLSMRQPPKNRHWNEGSSQPKFLDGETNAHPIQPKPILNTSHPARDDTLDGEEEDIFTFITRTVSTPMIEALDHVASMQRDLKFQFYQFREELNEVCLETDKMKAIVQRLEMDEIHYADLHRDLEFREQKLDNHQQGLESSLPMLGKMNSLFNASLKGKTCGSSR
ncbi:hypothetical protein Csa_013852 [Cucumis sativus]|nr:hypothetical protein Csa_013852 [Cucumis sativus]